MGRLRFLVILLAMWMVLLFNIERYDLLGINLPTVLYIACAVSLIIILVMPDEILAPGYALFVPILLVYAGARYISINAEDTTPVVLILTPELVILGLTILLGRWLSLLMTNAERTFESLLLDTKNSRVLPATEGEETINRELFRARKFSRPVSLLLIKTPSIEKLMKRADTEYTYQVSLQHRYVKARIAHLAESLLYSGDPIAWNGDDLVICLPETSEDEALDLAQRIAKVVGVSLTLNLRIGVAAFPEDGLIYSDLVDAAFIRLRRFHFADDQSDPDETMPSAPVNGRPKSFQDSQSWGFDSIDDGQQSAFSQIGFGFWRLTAQIHDSMTRAIDFTPPRAIATAWYIDGKPYRNPDFWVNRLPYQGHNSQRLYHRVKRALDILIILLASPMLFLVLGTTALAIYLEDQGPIFYSQLRTGHGGHKFRLYKFRSMILNADQRLEELGVSINERGETVDQYGNKLESDPRVTRVGEIIRKTSIDELPQLWNVLKGDMTLVGPRPTTFGTDKYTLFHTQRLSVKPGITGLWQIYDRGDTDFDNRLIWDIKYIDKMSFWLDMQILFRTVIHQVLKRRGA